MEERLYELEDKVQDLELEVHDLRERIQLLEDKPNARPSLLGYNVWVLIPLVAIISWMIVEVMD
ncbi:hypothetical protein ACP0AK_12930 [Listeria ivanovii]|uniref:Uncharacterized protein n=1 Tax=Listeria ivanovii (strain ATCC BAA-678 / PAM 55) TaxID=881621 RepID=G2ZEF4_LISIP|nr:hypothetical protein [Listeria ivanovii]AHI56767.1 ribulose-phosphate 3-epimerase [Listeria ivanovii WSLC3009]AIS66184.1 hypothetical protein JL52_11775 [Listeria ivanovii subsp. ivanovii]MBC1760423.1 hypothetical protein [Listeria ivanovii]MBK3913796.1 hypothetical protein [Listeria ivanovii subsp. ivanovii]MBK3921366.1 hypothetical protein [Listeria ivanovii subsp. ivanovii]